MGKTKISAGRLAREPSVPKLISVETSPPTTTTECTPSSPYQQDRSPSLPPANPPPEAAKNSLSSSPPSKPDTKKKANKPRPKPQPIPRRPLTLRSGKFFVPPLTRAQAEVEIPDNTSTVDGSPSSDESESEEVASGEHNSDLSEPDSPEPEHTQQTQEKQPEPPAVHPIVTDQPKSSRRRAPPEDFVFPAPKLKNAQMACGAPSLPPENLHFPKMQLRNRSKRDNAAKNKKKTKGRIVDEANEDVVPSHSSGDISSLHTKVDLLATVVLVNTKMLNKHN